MVEVVQSTIVRCSIGDLFYELFLALILYVYFLLVAASIHIAKLPMEENYVKMESDMEKMLWENYVEEQSSKAAIRRYHSPVKADYLSSFPITTALCF